LLYKNYYINKNYIYNNFDFELVLLKSIIFYKYEKGSVEIKIPVHNRSYFLYYDSELIDVILLEKMMNDMCIMQKLEIMCKKININLFVII